MTDNVDYVCKSKLLLSRQDCLYYSLLIRDVAAQSALCFLLMALLFGTAEQLNLATVNQNPCIHQRVTICTNYWNELGAYCHTHYQVSGNCDCEQYRNPYDGHSFKLYPMIKSASVFRAYPISGYEEQFREMQGITFTCKKMIDVSTVFTYLSIGTMIVCLFAWIAHYRVLKQLCHKEAQNSFIVWSV